MGSPIDPVTGLPMVGVPDVISQIPLGKQVVPWEDIGAISRPPSGPAYPNDILNTLAWVTGESLVNVGSMHSATMTEDRRLRVDATSTGGNGPSAVDREGIREFQGVDVSAHHRLAPFDTPLPQYLYSVSIAATMVPGSSGGAFATQIQVWLESDGIGPEITIATAWIVTTAPDPTWQTVVSFDPPLALNETYSNTTDNIYLTMLTDDCDLWVVFGWRVSRD